MRLTKEIQAIDAVIEPAMSDYNSPIVLDTRMDGTNRFCVNFNAAAEFDTEWIGNAEDWPLC